MSKVNTSINLLLEQLDNLEPGRMIVVRTEGYDFAGETHFVMSVAEFKDSDNNSWFEVVDVASHWEFLDKLDFKNGAMNIYAFNDGQRFIVSYMNNGHIKYEDMSWNDVRNEFENVDEVNRFLPKNMCSYFVM